VAIVGPVGVGKTFIAHALGHIACCRTGSVLAVRADIMLKTAKNARLDNTYEGRDAPARQASTCSSSMTSASTRWTRRRAVTRTRSSSNAIERDQ
jgi:hypothetical protein